MEDATKKKIGRPFLGDKKKDFMLRVRLSQDELEKLDKKCKENNKTRSEILRDFINQ